MPVTGAAERGLACAARNSEHRRAGVNARGNNAPFRDTASDGARIAGDEGTPHSSFHGGCSLLTSRAREPAFGRAHHEPRPHFLENEECPHFR